MKWPSRLKRLLFGANFKQNVEVADWPDGLEELTFGIYFNQPVELVKWWVLVAPDIWQRSFRSLFVFSL